MTAENADALRKLGVTKVSIGIESGSSASLANMGKSTTTQQNLTSIRILKDAGISVYVNLMYGLPGEKPGDLERTVDHFVDLSEKGDVYRVAGRVVTPLPNATWFFDLMKVRPDLKTDSDCLDLPTLQSAWLQAMTYVTYDDIQKAHSRLVAHAKERGISVSSETVRGIA